MGPLPSHLTTLLGIGLHLVWVVVFVVVGLGGGVVMAASGAPL